MSYHVTCIICLLYYYTYLRLKELHQHSQLYNSSHLVYEDSLPIMKKSTKQRLMSLKLISIWLMPSSTRACIHKWERKKHLIQYYWKTRGSRWYTAKQRCWLYKVLNVKTRGRNTRPLKQQDYRKERGRGRGAEREASIFFF